MKLGCEIDTRMKVVSVFGDDGGALAEAINQTFYNGVVIFRPSTIGGIWAAYCQSLKAVILMVEGIQTIKDNPNAWVLLKVCLIFHHFFYSFVAILMCDLMECMYFQIMALSDVVIYHQNSHMIHNDNAQLLMELSLTFMENYGPFLEAMCAQLKAGKNNLRSLGPDLVILHETPIAISRQHSESWFNFVLR